MRERIMAMLMAAVLCLSLAACGVKPVEPENPYEEYEDIFEMLEDEDYQGAIAAIQEMQNEKLGQTEEIEETVDSDEPGIEGSTEPEQADADVIYIRSAEELFSTVYTAEKTYILENDLDLTGYCATIPEIQGTFDGNGNTLYTATAPLVTENRGTIQNLNMENCQITALEDTAALVVNNYGMVFGCTASGSISATAENIYAGGIVCWNRGTIDYCANFVDVCSVSYALNELGNEVHGTFSCAGGISAYNHYGTITRCWNTGTISARDADYLSSCGGIVAINVHSEISNCYNTGTIIHPDGRGDSGGIAGNSEVEAKIVNCYNVGTAQSGICGDNRDYLIDCYYLSEVSENGSGSGLNPEGERIYAFTRDDLCDVTTFAAFDFDTVWTMTDIGPVLQ